MSVKKMFPCMLAACFLLSLWAVTAAAQIEETRPRQVTRTTNAGGAPSLETEPTIISLAEDEEDARPSAAMVTHPLHLIGSDQLLMHAIDDRLGARYVYGASGPSVFDCSGFVWSAYQSIGISFERGSARSLWSRFTPARKDEEFKFGTLVFFSGLTHVGIVADERGFYHASRHHGVTYAPFNEYWLSRIDGFRRVTLPPTPVAKKS